MSLSDGLKAPDANGFYLREIPKRVLVYEIEGPLVFGTIETFVRTSLSAGSGCDVLILRMRRTIYLDAGCLRILEGLVRDCHKKGIALFVSDIHTQPFMLAVNSGLDEKIGKDRFFGNLDEALAASVELVGITHEGKR
jgi:SulP family sulfate permease